MQRIGGVLPYYIEVEPGKSGMTALAGLSPYLDLMQVVKIRESVERHIHLLENGQGWTAAQLVTHAVLVNLAGGDCVDDLERLSADAGFGEVVRRVECAGMTRQQRREMERRFRRGGNAALLRCRRCGGSWRSSTTRSRRGCGQRRRGRRSSPDPTSTFAVCTR